MGDIHVSEIVQVIPKRGTHHICSFSKKRKQNSWCYYSFYYFLGFFQNIAWKCVIDYLRNNLSVPRVQQKLHIVKKLIFFLKNID